ncbi:MAG: hypothetical protein AB1390_10555 [Nitrospirota bacterium]
MKVLIFPDLEELSQKAAEIFAALSVKNMGLKGKFVAALSGASHQKDYTKSWALITAARLTGAAFIFSGLMNALCPMITPTVTIVWFMTTF